MTFFPPWPNCIVLNTAGKNTEITRSVLGAYRKPKPAVMAAKPKLWYFHGRGRMESIRWLLAAAGVEFEEEFLETREQYEKLQKDGRLLFGQVPLVEIDGMELTQTRAILSYLAAKYNLHGKDLKETVRYQSARANTWFFSKLCLPIRRLRSDAAFQPGGRGGDKGRCFLALAVKKAKTRYFPVFEKVGCGDPDFLVGNKFSWADIQLLEAILTMEELDASVLSDFPLLKEFKTRFSNIPTIKKFLQPGSQRKPPPDSHYVEVVRNILQF
ncbi:hypothetical protein E5288_WYG013830 [Bos mutus]|uniref:glutathione transferase n=1 Tax=Bos mutus TaxID=72004 RepID=A0A6B0S7Q2_9CETA|nr:hypothetical protein [Bos mutus]